MTAKRFAVFDIDGTLIRWQLFHAIFSRLSDAGHFGPDAAARIHDAYSQYEARNSDEAFKEYERILVDIVVKGITGVRVDTFNKVIDDVFEEYKDRVYRYTRQQIKDLKADGYTVLAISGSPQEIVTRLADYYGFDDAVGTEHVIRDGAFTGDIKVAVAHKPALLRELVAKHGLSFEGSIAIGDSEGDIDMLEIVEQPVAFNPSQKLFRHAESKGWHVVVERKNMIYELAPGPDGYRLAHTNAHHGD